MFENECGCTFHQDLVEGKVYEAKVVKVLDIGVVVGIGCVCCFIVPSSRAKVDLPHCGAYGFRPNEGLLHISEIAHSRTTPEEIHSTFSVGDPVTVMCTEVVCVVLSIVCFSSTINLFLFIHSCVQSRNGSTRLSKKALEEVRDLCAPLS